MEKPLFAVKGEQGPSVCSKVSGTVDWVGANSRGTGRGHLLLGSLSDPKQAAIRGIRGVLRVFRWRNYGSR